MVESSDLDPHVGEAFVKFRALLVMALSLASARAEAQQIDERARSAARTLAEDGVTALQGGDTALAVDKLERAYQIIRLPTVGIWSARALVKAGRLVSGAERYEEITRWSGTPADARQEQAKNDAARERDELLPRIPSATFVIEGAKATEVTVTLDGESVLAALIGTAQPVDPKHHVLRGTRGTDAVEQPFDIAEGQKLTVTLKLATPGAQATSTVTPAPTPIAPGAPPPAADARADHPTSSWSTQRTVGVVVGGAGVVSAVVSVIFTASALSKKSDADAYCKGSACTSDKGVSLLADARSAGNIATITGVAGAVLVGTGVVLFLTAPSGSKSSTVAIAPAYVLGGGSVVASGSF
jgi:hypothetical protein